MKTVTLTMAWGPHKAEAIICGAFAVHTLDGSPLDGWADDAWFAISHVGTGYRLASAEGRKGARKLAKALNAALPNGRDITRADFEPEWTDEYRAFVQRAKEIVRQNGGDR